MKRFIAAAVCAVSLAACTTDPVSPAAPAQVAASRTLSPATICSNNQIIVNSLISRVAIYTRGDAQVALMTPLRAAYAALTPSACDPAAATASMQQFIAAVNDNRASLSFALAYTFVYTAQQVIVSLQPLL